MKKESKRCPIDSTLLREWFTYDEELGRLRWKKCKARWVKPGSLAGSKTSDGYFEIGFLRHSWLLHRLVFLFFHNYTPEMIDHIDRNPSNNRIENLRESNKSLNIINSGLPSNNKSGVKGVSFSKINQKWTARFKRGNKYLFLGYFNSIEEATTVRKLYEQGGSKDEH